jgi:D-aspartate ligase
MEILSHEQTRLPSKSTVGTHIQDIGAVVLGGCFQGLGIVRSLGRRGIPVCVLDDELAISRYSRYTTQTIHVKNLKDEDQIIQALLSIKQRLGLAGWVLYPTRDEIVVALSHFHDELSTCFRVPTPSWEVIRWSGDKRNTYELATKLSIPTPQTWCPRDVSELADLEDKLPLVIKPAIKEHFVYATKAKAWRADTASELRERFLQAYAILGPGETMVQELIPGDGQQQFSYCAFFKDKQALGSMVAQRRRQHPLDFGRASTFVETMDVPLLAELSNKFLSAIDYYGLVEVEFKYDLRDHTYKLLDVNTRTWGYHSLGAQAGVDFSAMLFADQLGQTVEPCQARPGVKWVRLITDLPTGLQEMRQRRLNWSDYWKSLKHFDVEAVFDWHDPAPGLIELSLAPYLYFKRGF